MRGRKRLAFTYRVSEREREISYKYLFFRVTFQNLFRLDQIWTRHTIPILAKVTVKKLPKTPMRGSLTKKKHCRGYFIGPTGLILATSDVTWLLCESKPLTLSL